MQFLNWCIGGAVLLTVSASAMAALPAPGLWAMNDEVNGKPGRGIQIDRQGGETIIISYYGYRADGSAVFYQAVGKITDGMTFSADLIEYKNGPSLSGSHRSGEISRIAGPIKLVFDSAESGVMELPGTSAQSISRYSFEDTSQRLLASYFNYASVARKGSIKNIKTGYIYFAIDKNKLLAFENSDDGMKCQYSGGPLEQRGDSFRSRGFVSCQWDKDSLTQLPYHIDGLKVNESGLLAGNIRIDDAPAELQHRSILGECVTGERPGDEVTATHTPTQRCSPQSLGMTEATTH
ncbi:hypothetical protein H9K76_15735 [Diaphorobacter ruginosibacter]|uniref:Uncharacterized protein n=1 Tax=Diaphorobacter ruginosibacter TaxID=1715720 RepID=A0A7G9RKA0_9BURK|nr:hypothetical protein [Diaphorobacter ruginosibacter]QNN56025.1 hypothetical protein H9K76_15735 [Diaphorobacter ruginosibacter]